VINCAKLFKQNFIGFKLMENFIGFKLMEGVLHMFLYWLSIVPRYFFKISAVKMLERTRNVDFLTFDLKV
jgi:hypothetical protein